MKADLTRLTFDATKHYRAVQQQQGRVQLDSDWNEQNDIAAHRVETETLDVVGPFGAPMHDDGFRLVARLADLTADEAARAENKNAPALAGADLLITGGRLYAGGVLAENDRICLASAQPDWPSPAELASVGVAPLLPLTAPGTYLAYLDVWPRLCTAIDDPHIREVALGGPDTATRARNAWQVKFLPAPDGGDCATPLPAWDTLLDPQPGTLAASVAKVSSKPSPCIVDPGSGYRRLENQLYRVEVHQGGASLAQASFKWSRDNGSVVTKWLGQNALGEITVESTGRDKVLNLTPAQWVELTDDVHEELGLPGVFAQIASVNGDVLTLTAPVAAMDFAHFPRNPKVRRWDSAPASPGKWITPDGNGVNLNTTDQFELEDGVVVKFGAGSFRAGDYWLIPARTALPQVDWPTTGPANAPAPVPQPPHGVEHQYCRLAVVQFKGGVFTITDCRSLFPPLTELTSLFYVSGESQEATPDPTQPAATLLPLTLPLKVGVANGEWPVVGARVRFTVIAGGGALNPASGIVLTGADGIASCTWSINATVTNPEVIAELLDAGGKRLGEPVIIHARLNTARQVAYDPANCVGMRNAKPPVVTVQAALDFLCRAQADVDCCVTIGRIGEQRGDYDTVAEALEDLLTKRGLRAACLSLLPGDHVLDHDLLITPPDEKRGTFFKLAGCSHAARLIVQAPLVFRRLAAVVVRDISILVDGGRVDFDACLEVEVSNCLVRGRATDTALFNLSANRRVAFDGNQIAAAAPAKPAAPGRILGLLPRLSKAFEALDDQDFEIQAAAAAAELAQLPPKDRAALAKQLAEAVKAPDTGLDAASRKGYAEMLRTLGAGRATANTLLNRFKAIRAAAAAQAAPVGLALAVLDSVTDLTLMDNQVQGTISLGGQPASAPLSRDELKLLSDLKNREAIQFAPTAGNIRLRGNSLQQLGPGEAALADLRSLIHAQKGTLNLQGAMQLSDNVIVQGGNFFSACHVSLVATCFLETRADLGVVLASSATHVGSSADNDVPLFNLSVRPPGLAANVGLAIVVL